MRAIAIALVLWQHTPILFGQSGLDVFAPLWRPSLMAWWGVDLFFVLSGFLITRILLRTVTATRGLRTFWVRRALRIFPLFYLYLLAVFLYGKLGGFLVEEQPWGMYLFHLANIEIAVNDFGLPIFGMLWSLALEEQFYGVFPLLVRRLSQRKLVILCLAVIAIVPCLRLALYQWTDLERPAFHVLLCCRADTLAIGALVGIAWEKDAIRLRLQKVAPWLLPPSFAVIALVFAGHFGPWVCIHETAWTFVGYTAVGLACAVILVWAASAGSVATALLGNPLTVHLGRVSYGVYLWHCLVGTLAVRLPIESAEVRVGIFLLATLAISTLSFTFWEQPFLRRKIAYAV